LSTTGWRWMWRWGSVEPAVDQCRDAVGDCLRHGCHGRLLPSGQKKARRCWGSLAALALAGSNATRLPRRAQLARGPAHASPIRSGNGGACLTWECPFGAAWPGGRVGLRRGRGRSAVVWFGQAAEAGDLGSGTWSSDDGAGVARRSGWVALGLGRSAGAQLGRVAGARDLGSGTSSSDDGAGVARRPIRLPLWSGRPYPAQHHHAWWLRGAKRRRRRGTEPYVAVFRIENDISHA
jgi:hypothetical protein